MIENLALLSFSNGGWGVVILSSAGITLSLALCCGLLGLPLGLLCAIMIRSNIKAARAIATLFSSVFRSLPELLTLFLVYYGLQNIIQIVLDYFNIEIMFSINAFVAGVVTLSMVLAAFSCEVWLGAFNVFDRGQYEAAKALGLSNSTTFFRIVFPQLFRNALPGLSNNWLTLLKDTSLVSTISLVDLMRQTNLAVAATDKPMLFYLVACLLYLLFSAFFSAILHTLETYTQMGYRKVLG
ncbi:His/Glu/Gln/Arg/opine family amino ABC transporter, permease, 3-TM region [Bartonella vinsonii subsp. arupensis OK-94-513]|uniref:His/Glu/Gln/Arg/opine family amino ABC transporter, permease, 3-TM region n=1 Tax=Bartonella vinsonii subsp. arupensis OK-94-513 TaxID=1094562 RepID=J0QWP0_BARVI|nr:ABC transporter permease subunit [Bartonella vinsonii]EJF87589.1 His/Glu/Gln/Arg/opine family amino ABC transporter, permease, 3-TM region [Bartonella vinsonii subsp. arupensis OK-94-513]